MNYEALKYVIVYKSYMYALCDPRKHRRNKLKRVHAKGGAISDGDLICSTTPAS